MAITSSFYDTTPGTGITETEWARNRFGGASYGVAGAGDWKVTAVAGQDRTISIAAGKGFGYGVADESDANETRQLGSVASGTRWDLIAAHRDWQPAGGGPTSFTVIPGASSQAIPTGRVHDPGVEDDQPLALVEVIAGQTGVGRIIDLRCWASNGGIVAADPLALSYLSTPGAVVQVGGTEYKYLPGANGVFGWSTTGSIPASYAPVSANGFYSNTGVIQVSGGTRHVAITVVRNSPDLTLSSAWANFGQVIPVAARTSTARQFYLPGHLYGGGVYQPILIFVNMQSGDVQARIQSGSITFDRAVSFDINLVAVE